MTTVDWLIVALAAAMAIPGYQRGFIVGGLTLLGFLGGAFAGARIAPLVLSGGSASPYAPMLALIGAVLVGGLLAAGFEIIGRAVRTAIVIPGAGVVDGTLGALLSVCLALGIAWLAGAAALQTPGATSLRADIQRSAILRRLNRVLPPSGSILNALARFDPLGEIAGPQAHVGPPDAAIARVPAIAGAAGGVVRVLGSACGLGVEGSGWIVAPDTVVTNAHVVAGETDTTVQLRGTGDEHPATVVAFDSHNDVAVLHVPGLGGEVLSLAEQAAPSGTSAALLGFPGDGSYDVRATRLGSPQSVLTEDAYGRGPVERTVVPLRGLVRPGNSGGPLVDADGRVVATVFAKTTNRGSTEGGLAIPDSIVEHVLAGAGAAVSTGPCAQ